VGVGERDKIPCSVRRSPFGLRAKSHASTPSLVRRAPSGSARTGSRSAWAWVRRLKSPAQFVKVPSDCATRATRPRHLWSGGSRVHARRHGPRGRGRGRLSMGDFLRSYPSHLWGKTHLARYSSGVKTTKLVFPLKCLAFQVTKQSTSGVRSASERINESMNGIRTERIF